MNPFRWFDRLSTPDAVILYLIVMFVSAGVSVALVTTGHVATVITIFVILSITLIILVVLIWRALR